MDTEIRPRTEEDTRQDAMTEREEQLHLIDKLAYLRRRRENILDDLVSVDEEIDCLQSYPINHLPIIYQQRKTLKNLHR